MPAATGPGDDGDDGAGRSGWLSPDEAAARLAVTPQTLYRLIDAGRLPAMRFGRVVRIREIDVDRFGLLALEVGLAASSYGAPMQIAISLPDEQVDEIDGLVPGEFRSRAEVVRVAVAAWLAERRSAAVDARYRAAYEQQPTAVDRIDSGAAGTGDRPHPWDALGW